MTFYKAKERSISVTNFVAASLKDLLQKDSRFRSQVHVWPFFFGYV